MKNLQQMMKQAQQAQARMAEIQAEMERMEVTGESGGGSVKITLTGKGEARKVEIDKAVIDPEDKEVLEDLIAAAVNDAVRKVEQNSQEKMSGMTAGMQLPPGFKMPF